MWPDLAACASTLAVFWPGIRPIRKTADITRVIRKAPSVIENVIYANGLERRWIQNRPTILYGNQLVGTLWGRFGSYMRNKRRKKPARKKPPAIVFTKQPLSQDGMAELDPPLKLLNGPDILAYIKSIDTSEAVKQYLDHAERLKPQRGMFRRRKIWASNF